MKKADNIFVRAKAYVKEHPRTSFQDAIQKVKGKKVSGVKAKPKTKTAKPATKAKRPRISGATKVTRTTTTVGRSPKNELLNVFLRIDSYEEMLRTEHRKGVKNELINKINNLHDKADRLKAKAIH